MRLGIKFTMLALSALFVMQACTGNVAEQFNVLDFGAAGDGKTDCTEAFNSAIAKCSSAKGIVVVPAGRYLCRTIHLQSDVELRLSEGSEILGWEDSEAYDNFVPQRDLSMYDSGNGTLNQNNSKDARWNRALILANKVDNVAITGSGTINGRHVFDPLGEERMRGPHAIVFGDCHNVRLEGISITCAANYAFMGYALENAVFRDVRISEGWDGIHIRGGVNVLIEGCRFETGDDSVAGGYWTSMEMRDCYVNSSCNGVRMIMPSDGINIHDCRFEGPGHYPHRTSGEARRTNMLYGVIIEPGGWGAAPGDLKGFCITDCTMENTLGPVAVSIGRDNHAYDLTVRNLTATGVYGKVCPVVNDGDKSFDKVTAENVTVSR